MADFGLSRTKELCKTYSDQTPNNGTSRWIVPEGLLGGKSLITTDVSGGNENEKSLNVSPGVQLFLKNVPNTQLQITRI